MSDNKFGNDNFDVTPEFAQSEIQELLNSAPWYRRYLNLPSWYHNKTLNVFTFQLWDCTTVNKSLTRLHRFDVLISAHRKWWQPKYMGFQIWY